MIYTWGSVKGTVAFDSCNVTSATAGAASSAVLIQWNATDGTANWCTAPGGSDVISASYMDISPALTDPVLAVTGSFSGTKTFGSVSLTATFGYYTSFVARLSTTDGSVTWAEVIPMSRGVQVTPDNKFVGVFCQTTGTTDRITLTDANSVSTTLRSRGSWDLISLKLDATDGGGIYAMDGGGDNMEYFHGFGMTGDGDQLISGYSRSSTFHFGDHSMPNTGGDGQNKIFTIQVSNQSSTPSCVASCASNTPVVKADKCFIDNYCYADQQVAPYPAHACFKCDSATSSTEWTGPDVTDACYIMSGSVGSCYTNGESKPAGRGVSSCQACLPEKSTSAWTIRDTYDYVAGSCVSLATITTTTTAALTTAMTASAKVTEFNTALKTSFAAAKAVYVRSHASAHASAT